jgi:hypothetical protein
MLKELRVLEHHAFCCAVIETLGPALKTIHFRHRRRFESYIIRRAGALLQRILI